MSSLYDFFHVLNLLSNKELPNTSESLTTHPKAAKAGVNIREFVNPNNNPAAIGIVMEL
jgi:hypothetical protein